MARLLILAGADINKKNNVHSAFATFCPLLERRKSSHCIPPCHSSYSCKSKTYKPPSRFALQDGLTCCDEARADGHVEFVTFLQACRRSLCEVFL